MVDIMIPYMSDWIKLLIIWDPDISGNHKRTLIIFMSALLKTSSYIKLLIKVISK